MNRERFARLREILVRATELPKEERAAYLKEACGDDTELLQEAEAVLAREGDSPSFLGSDGTEATVDRSHARDSAGKSAPQGPRQIGPYRILERLGEGGFGEVFAAEQSEPVKRRVALKVLKAGMETREVLARFEAERQALAMMDHPNVCRVLDAGETPHGRPYFVMELIHGEPITQYCDHHRLTMEERLHLFLPVCQAIQHAHQKGVIHRDVKPSNVLVTLVDGKPVPKVIDFGIAKATAQSLTEKTLYTMRGQIIGTPAYMSPEQAELTGLDVDTRTDVYSLGVLLYELLTGRLPFETRTLKEAGLDAMRRMIREEEPPKPSTRVSTLGEEATEAAARRRTDPAHWRKALHRELDWIVMKSLEKDRNRRYETVSGMAADVGRYLADEPVLAGPPSTVYRMRKYVRRHRVAVGFAGLIVVGVASALVLVAAQNARIATARDEAEAVTTTLEEMLASVDPTKSGRDVTVKEMLDQTAKTLAEKFKDQPLVEARLHHTVGKTYYALGEFDTAEAHFGKAISIRREQVGETDSGTLEAKSDLARTYMNVARYPEAEALLQEVLEASRRLHGEEHPQTVHAMAVLGMCYNEHGLGPEKARPLLERAVDLGRHVLGETNPRTVDYMNALGITFRGSGRYDEAEVLFKRALEISRRALGDEHPITLKLMVNLAANHMAQGNHDESEKLLRRALETGRRVLGAEHRVTMYSMWNLAITYSNQGRHNEAEKLFRECWEKGRRSFGEGHPATLEPMVRLALTCARQGRRDEFESLGRMALEASLHIPDEGPWNGLRYNLACIAALIGRRDEAISYLRNALDRGYSPQSGGIREDPDLVSLHGDPEFEAIVEELRRKNEEAETAESDGPTAGEGGS